MNLLRADPFLVSMIRWIVRLLSLFVVLLILIFVLGEGIPDFTKLSVKESLIFIVFGLMLIGSVVGWKWEGIGGVIILIGFALFTVLNGRLWAGWVFALFPLIACLNLYCSWGTRRLTKKPNAFSKDA